MDCCRAVTRMDRPEPSRDLVTHVGTDFARRWSCLSAFTADAVGKSERRAPLAGVHSRHGASLRLCESFRRGAIAPASALRVAGLILLVIFVPIGVIAWANSVEKRGRDSSIVQDRAEFEEWAVRTPDWNLPPILVRTYGGRDPNEAAWHFQREAGLLATRGYAVASTSAGTVRPGVGGVLAFGLLAFGGRLGTLTVTYARR